MLNSLQEISQNNFVNDFVRIAEQYGLSGAYIKTVEDNEPQERVYFICGTDKNTIKNGMLDLKKIESDNRKNHGFFNPHIAVFRVDTADPFSLHQFVVYFCKNAEFAQNIYADYNMPLPKAISFGLLDAMKMFHYNAGNTRLPQPTRQAYERLLIKTLRQENKYHDPSDPEYKRFQRLKYGHYDSTKSKLNNFFRLTFKKDPNCVSLHHLVNSSNSIGIAFIHKSDIPTFRRELRNRPEILYWMSKINGKKLNLPNGQGYGSAEKNDRRFVNIAFDEAYRADISNIINRISWPESYKLTPEEITNEKGIIQRHIIPQSNYEEFIEKCREEGVKFCIDKNETNTIAGSLNVITSSPEVGIVNDILREISSRTECSHFYKIEGIRSIAEMEAEKAESTTQNTLILNEEDSHPLADNQSVDIGEIIGDDCR